MAETEEAKPWDMFSKATLGRRWFRRFQFAQQVRPRIVCPMRIIPWLFIRQSNEMNCWRSNTCCCCLNLLSQNCWLPKSSPALDMNKTWRNKTGWIETRHLDVNYIWSFAGARWIYNVVNHGPVERHCRPWHITNSCWIFAARETPRLLGPRNIPARGLEYVVE